MKDQRIILLGILIWLAGVILDAMLTRYSYMLIHLGTLATILGCLKWIKVKENREHLKETFFIKRSFVEMIGQAFDFDWYRISTIWTICLIWGILLVHLIALGMRSTGAYEAAIKSVSTNEKVLKEVGEILHFSYMVTGHSTTYGISNLNIGIVGRNKNISIEAIVDGANGTYKTKKIILRD